MRRRKKAVSHTDRALVELRRKIVNGSYPGGSRLLEVATAEELNISRTPVRAALSQLAEEGLLERTGRGGFVVRSFNFRDVEDTIELRGMLEGLVARLAAERGAPEAGISAAKTVLQELDGCFAPATRTVELERYAALNREFHLLLPQLSGSASISRELDRVTRLPFASPSAFLSFNTTRGDAFEHYRTAQDEHWGILRAIEARTPQRAETLARAHAQTARENLRRMTTSKDAALPVSPVFALVTEEEA